MPSYASKVPYTCVRILATFFNDIAITMSSGESTYARSSIELCSLRATSWPCTYSPHGTCLIPARRAGLVSHHLDHAKSGCRCIFSDDQDSINNSHNARRRYRRQHGSHNLSSLLNTTVRRLQRPYHLIKSSMYSFSNRSCIRILFG